MSNEISTDVLIAGGGVGGCAAALAVSRAGYRCILTEETDWIGGQLTSQAVPPDEHGWIERFGCTSTYRQYRNSVRDYYRTHYPLTDSARSQKHLNPGSGWVSPLCHEPRVGVAVLEDMLAPYIHGGSLKILKEHRPVSAETKSSDRVAAVTFEEIPAGRKTTVSARYFLDATELGDLLPLCNVEFVTGSESQNQTGEPSAPVIADPGNSQAFSWCFAMGYDEGANHVIDKPSQYEEWKNYLPKLTPPWPGRLFSWAGSNPRTMGRVEYSFDPNAEEGRAFEGLWSYRRILARSNFASGAFPSDICIVNWPMIDYWRGDVCTGSPEQNQYHFEQAKEQSRSFFYWLQTEAPRRDGGMGYPGLQLRGDATATSDGLAKSAYIRESRRVRAEFTVCEQHVSADLRKGKNLAECFADSVGIGYYRIDLHPTTGGNNYLDVAALPFQIPLGAIIPCRVNNLLPAAKNLGVTHITNGCYRLHPVEWNIGEVAGTLASHCIQHGRLPREILHNKLLLADFQNLLRCQGIELQWPENLCLNDGDPHAHALSSGNAAKK
jgi:hypothetical protein